ncbi:GlcNAc-transferase family protein [Catenuloplanes japonicus]|uniref:GlcNAc-transferase family protein n=1 Tax=Catenuloplanes japonicus TaxID=33876 RepID=UPI000523F6AF|nr:GlcNAc-transferase family protein [Catenuloplanes japonicus]
MTIFVSVASYRDPELVPTVLDCLAKADRPDALRITVNWQHRGDEDVTPLRADPRVTLLEFDARESRGACWARAVIMDHYRGADWYLQVDSHTRFAPGWDRRLIDTAVRTGSAKPVISGYPPRYTPGAEVSGAGRPTRITIDRWRDDGLPVFGSAPLGDELGTAFVAAGFLFAPGSFPREVPYDPGLYFQGEEITVAVRAYTWGYDLFHPAEVLAWHHYVRAGAPRHWTDHREWAARDRRGRRRALTLLRHPAPGRFGTGPVRTVRDYEAYAGVSFRPAP